MFNYTILETKLNRPKCFQPYFERERLEKLLDDNSDGIATFIIAGAGYGKSTLVSEWIKGKPAIWLSCDADMNALEVFLSYMVFGFVKADINSFTHTSQLLSSPNPVNEELLTNTFFSEINATSQKTYVILDNFHLLKSPQVVKLLEIYLNYPPNNIHVIILSRHDPIFTFPRQRLNHAFVEIRMQDLNLTETELERYAFSSFDLTLQQEETDLILRKTEGWFLGVNQLLYALKELNIPLIQKNEVLQQQQQQQQFSAYFADEVINRQSEESIKILFVSSLFSQFSKALIATILKGIGAGLSELEITQTLSNKNNFTIGLDSSRKWFRFHHQFLEALEQYFANHPFNDLRNKCLQIGGAWLIKNNFFEDGIIKTIEAGNTKLAVKHLQKFRYKLLDTDQYTRLGHILSLFPLSVQNNDAELLLVKSFILENQGKREALAELIKKSSKVLSNKELSNQQQGEYKLMKTLLTFFSANYKKALDEIDKTVELLDPYSQTVMTFAVAYKSLVLNALGRNKEALNLLKTRLDSLPKNQHQSIVRTLMAEAVLYSVKSDLGNMQRILPQIIEKSALFKFHQTHGMSLYLQIELNYRTGNYAQNEKLFEEITELKYLMRPVSYAYMLSIQASCYLKWNKNKLEKTLNELHRFSDEQNAENIFQLENALLVEVALKEGNDKEALRLHRITVYHRLPPVFYYYLPQITKLKVLLYVNNASGLDEFYEAFAELWVYAQNQSHQNLLLKLNLLYSEAAFIQNQTTEAFMYMNKALTISERTGDLMVYTEFSKHVHEILVSIKVDETLLPHLQDVLALFEDSASNKLTNGIDFKERDVKLLELVSAGHTNAQIAEKMFLSPESVKKYLYNIFQDLGVKNRMNAVLEAKRVGILQE